MTTGSDAGEAVLARYPREVALATEQARFALAYIQRVSRRTGLELRDEVLQERLVAPATRALSRSFDSALGADSALPIKKGS